LAGGIVGFIAGNFVAILMIVGAVYAYNAYTAKNRSGSKKVA